MKFANLKVEPCLVVEDPNQPAGGSGPGEPSERTCVSLEVIPPDGFVELGQTWQFLAILTYSDGTTEDVTLKASWTSSEVATITNTGLATSVSAGYATITAQYCEKAGFASLQVVAGCAGQGLDYVVVLDRSSGVKAGTPGHTVEENIRNGIVNFFGHLKENDQMGMVSFAGVKNPGPPASSAGEATLDHILSDDSASLILAGQAYGVRTPCPYPDPTTGPGTKCSKGIGTGLEVAKAELESERHIAGRQRVCILIFQGRNMVGLPDPVALAELMQDEGIIMCVIGIQVPATYTADAIAMANCGWYFPSNDGSDIPAILNSLPYQLCYSYTGLCYSSSSRSTCIDPPDEGSDLCGLRWEMPCVADMPGNAYGCTCSDPDDVVGVMGGTIGHTYAVTCRFSGVIELKNYAGGANDGKFFQVGGYPVEDNGDGGYNRYSLIVSDPPQTYYVNRRWDVTPADAPGDKGGILKVDYEQTILIKGGASVTLRTRSQDGLEFRNYHDFKFDDVPPTDAPFNGQFLQLTVIAVS